MRTGLHAPLGKKKDWCQRQTITCEGLSKETRKSLRKLLKKKVSQISKLFSSKRSKRGGGGDLSEAADRKTHRKKSGKNISGNRRRDQAKKQS